MALFFENVLGNSRLLRILNLLLLQGKRNPRSADPTVDHDKNPQFLILLSDGFMEARAALSRPFIGSMAPNQNIVKLEGNPAPPIQGPTASIPSGCYYLFEPFFPLN